MDTDEGDGSTRGRRQHKDQPLVKTRIYYTLLNPTNRFQSSWLNCHHFQVCAFSVLPSRLQQTEGLRRDVIHKYTRYLSFKTFDTIVSLVSSSLGNTNNFGVTFVKNTQNGNLKVFPACSTKICVGTLEVVDNGLGKHGVVFDFTLSNSGRVVGD